MRRLFSKLAPAVFVLCLGAGSVFAVNQPWYVDYKFAIDSIERGEYATAEKVLRDLTQRIVVPSDNARTYGVWRTDYTPYYFLGVSLAEQGKLDEAIKSFDVGVKFGVVERDPKKMAVIREYRTRLSSTAVTSAQNAAR